MINVTINRPAPLIQDLLNLTFRDIQWAIGYPDGSYAVGLAQGWVAGDIEPSELYGRALARTRGLVMGDMGYEIIEAGWMKPRGVPFVGPVVVFKLTEAVCRA